MVPLCFLGASLSLASAGASCEHTVDEKLVRGGQDYRCFSMPSGADALDDCIGHCCDDSSSCRSFSWNAPWGLDPWNNCKPGENCCCLKNGVPDLEPSSWNFTIVTGVVPAPAPAPCLNQVDCSLNGECRDGSCACDAGWTGLQCSVLDMVPAESLDGTYQFHDGSSQTPATSTWGALPLKGPDGKYHLFASQFVNHCILSGWNPASTVVRAVADDPMGPYEFAETVFGTFHHNPSVRELTPEQSGTGKPLYVMYMIGMDRDPPTGSGKSCRDSAGDPHHLEGYITMAWSESLLGPWTKGKHTLITNGDVNDWDAMVTNPSPLFPFQNETAYLFYRGTEWPHNGQERIGLTKAASWRGPYGRLSDDPIFTGRKDDPKTFVEDPFIWMDHKGRGVKGLFHGHFDEKGYYGFAEHIEGPWIFRDEPAYTNVVMMSDGSKQTLVQRERPQVWFDERTGEPSILFTGVAPPGAAFYGETYTFAQRIRKAASEVNSSAFLVV